MNSSQHRVLIPVLLAFFACPGLHAAESVSVTESGDQLTLRVVQTTDLKTALQSFCEQTRSSCEIPAAITSKALAPVTIKGTWSQVAARLLEGSGFNYVASPPAGGRTGKLLINASPTTAAVMQPSSDGQRSQGPTSSPVVETPQQSGEGQQISQGNEAPQSYPAGNEQLPGTSPASQGSNPTLNSAVLQDAGVAPVPDAKGNAIVSPSGGVGGILPGPDGKPIAIDSSGQSSGVALLPDAKGRPIVSAPNSAPTPGILPPPK